MHFVYHFSKLKNIYVQKHTVPHTIEMNSNSRPFCIVCIMGVPFPFHSVEWKGLPHNIERVLQVVLANANLIIFQN